MVKHAQYVDYFRHSSLELYTCSQAVNNTTQYSVLIVVCGMGGGGGVQITFAGK